VSKRSQKAATKGAELEGEEQLQAHEVVGILFDLWKAAKEVGVSVEELIEAVREGLTPREAVAIAAEVARRGDLPGGPAAFRHAFRLASTMRQLAAAEHQLDRDDIREQASSLGIGAPPVGP
jgi:hypothetical protein